MTGSAVRTDVYVDHHGPGTSHWRLEPPLDGHDHIIVADRTWLTGVRRIDLPGVDLPEWVNGPNVRNVVPTLVEVLPADAGGNVVGDMVTLREPVSLTRPQHGIDVSQILAALGYQEDLNG